MGGRDAEVTEFIATRGPALWRTASLLVIDAGEAEALVVSALRQTRREWATLTRDHRVEARARELIGETFLAQHGSAGSLDTRESSPQNASPARVALATLTARQRAALVLTAYANVSTAELAGWLGCSSDDVTRVQTDGERLFRERVGAAAAPLLSLLNAAALSDVPADLTERTLTETRPGRRRGVVAIGTLAVVLAITAVFVQGGGSDDATGAETALNEWGVPRDLTVPSNVTSLRQVPIDRASTAFVVDGLPLVASDSGAVRSVFDSTADRELVTLEWSQAVLSPDGTRLLLVRVVPDVRGRLAPSSRANVGAVFVVDIVSGDVARIPGLVTSPRGTGVAGIARTNLAWAPDSGGFACACSSRLTVAQLDAAATTASVSRTEVRARAVAWGQPGLAVDDPLRGWTFVNLPLSVDGAMTHAAAFAASYADPATFVTVSPLSIYALAADSTPDGGRCVRWDVEFGSPIPVAPMSERDGLLCTPVALQPTGDGFALVMSRQASTHGALEVLIVDADGSASSAGAFPEGTTTASFAADLVG